MISTRHLALGLLACTTSTWSLPAQGIPSPDVDRAHHVLRRVTFGPTPDLVARLTAPPSGATPLQEVQTYLAEQLAPTATDPHWPYGSQDVQNMVQPGGWLGVPASPSPGVPFNKVITDGTQLMYALDSKWQLREVMAQFWERHFNTHLFGASFYFNQYLTGTQTTDDYAWYFEWEANNEYREKALGSFHQLLDFTTKHVSMVVYLHLYENVITAPGQEPNEDYARELLELYTMGQKWNQGGGVFVDNYDQDDIETVARILSGWNVDPTNDFTFVFNGADHDAGPKPTLFVDSGVPFDLPAGTFGQAEGDALLLELAGREATKDFICRKLIDYFLADGAADVETNLLNAMKGAWGATGDIAAVLNELFTFGGVFLDPTSPYVLDRARLPLEAVLAPPRAFGATIDSTTPFDALNSLLNTGASLEFMGQSLLNYPAPNGFPQASLLQHSPSAAIERLALGAVSLFEVPIAVPPAPPIKPSLEYDVVQHVVTLPNPLDPRAIAKRLLELQFGSNYTLADEDALILTMGNAVLFLGANPLAPTPQEYDTIVRCAAVTAMGMAQGGIR